MLQLIMPSERIKNKQLSTDVEKNPQIYTNGTHVFMLIQKHQSSCQVKNVEHKFQPTTSSQPQFHIDFAYIVF